jgi:hypothetical protein
MAALLVVISLGLSAMALAVLVNESLATRVSRALDAGSGLPAPLRADGVGRSPGGVRIWAFGLLCVGLAVPITLVPTSILPVDKTIRLVVRGLPLLGLLAMVIFSYWWNKAQRFRGHDGPGQPIVWTYVVSVALFVLLLALSASLNAVGAG